MGIKMKRIMKAMKDMSKLPYTLGLSKNPDRDIIAYYAETVPKKQRRLTKKDGPRGIGGKI